MGALYDLSQRAMKGIEARHADPIEQIRAKGQLAVSAGFMVSLVSTGDQDDPEKIASLRAAAESMGIQL